MLPRVSSFRRSWTDSLVALVSWIGVATVGGLAIAPTLLAATPASTVQVGQALAKDLHFTGDRTFWDRKKNRIHLAGNAALHRVGESITADVIDIDQNTRMIDARGRCVYTSGEMIIQGDAFSFNLDTRKGVITNGRVSSRSYTLTGNLLKRLDGRRFITEEGAYSTCMDCPQSWTLMGSEVDMEFEGYGRMKNVMAAVKDVPVFWLPYLVIPLKTRRQSGFLFPTFGYQNEGFTFVLPYFWDISRSADMTLSAGYFTGRGTRLEWEGRYALTPRSGGRMNLYSLRDAAFEEFLVSKGLDPSSHRWALAIEQSQELPLGIEQKLKLYEMSDQLYPSRVGDIPGNGEAFVGSELFLSHSTDEISTWLGAKYFRNLVSLDPDPRTRDSSTVHVLPMARISTNDKYLFDGTVALGGSVGLANFVREGSYFDQDLFTEALPDAGFRPGIDPIRRATRLSFFPKISTIIRPWDSFSLVPSLQYKGYFYSFPAGIPSLSRGYLQAKVQAFAQLERTFETDDPLTPRLKHIIRPRLTWSRIPLRNEDGSHPFVQQLAYAESNSFSGFQFDSDDTVPFGTTGDANVYFIPQGHSLGLDLSSQLIQRQGRLDQKATYRRALEVNVGESVDFLEYQKSAELARPWSRFNLGLNSDLGWFSSNLLYYYWPYGEVSDTRSRHQITTQAFWILERGIRQEILAFDRSFNLSYTHKQIGADRTNLLSMGSTFSVNDYLMPRAQLTWDLLTESLQRADATLRIQHPSRCYQFELTGSRFVCPIQRAEDTGICYGLNFNLTLNLTGSSFFGADQVAAGAAAPR